MINEIKKVLNKPLEDLNLTIDEVKYENKTLYITLDSTETLDIDKIVKATNVISPILDQHDYIKESYTLDVSSKEKGGN